MGNSGWHPSTGPASPRSLQAGVATSGGGLRGPETTLQTLHCSLSTLWTKVLGVEKCLDPRNGEQQTALGRKTSFDGSFWERDLKSNVWEARLFPV